MSKRTCIRCKGWPCVCHYIAKISADEGVFGQMARGRTDRWLNGSGPERRHKPRLECPCVECYRVRLGSWEVER